MSRSTERELITNLFDSIKERLQYSIDNNEFEDMDNQEVFESIDDYRHEIIDNELPIYYSDMAKLLAENTNFASVDDNGILPENPTVWDIITASVSEFLNNEFTQLLWDAIDELLPNLGDEE